MKRPFWSGQVQISLVSFAVNLFPAVEAKSEIHFHQLSRKTGERVHHQKVADDEGPLVNDDIVKGYEYKKGKYLAIDPQEIAALRIQSSHTIDITQSVDLDEIAPEYFEKAYFLLPGKEEQAKTFAVIRKALAETKKAALGKIAFGGREHLLAIAAPVERKSPGMMAYTLHFAEELRNLGDHSGNVKQPQVRDDELSLALELIKKQSSRFVPSEFTDEYETALKQLVQAKLHKRPIPREEPEAKPGKVINLMDALRKSVNARPHTSRKSIDHKTKTSVEHRGPVLVKGRSKRSRKRA